MIDEVEQGAEGEAVRLGDLEWCERGLEEVGEEGVWIGHGARRHGVGGGRRDAGFGSRGGGKRLAVDGEGDPHGSCLLCCTSICGVVCVVVGAVQRGDSVHGGETRARPVRCKRVMG